MNAQTKKTARAVADLTAGTIIATVEIAAPAERIFNALTTKEVTKWWGSDETYRTTEFTADVRVGGTWRAGGKGADGVPFGVEGEYLEVERWNKIVQTWKADWEGGAVSTVTYRLEPTGGGTRVTVRHEGFGSRRESCEAHTAGWELVLAALARHTAPEAATGPEGRYFLIKLIPPRPTFPQAMTEEEGKAMQAHVGYWMELLQTGTAFAFGPVADPAGTWGVGIVKVKDEAALAELQANDPAPRSGLGFKTVALPMLDAVVRA